jgi:class 3 adenylate cyclase
VLHRRDLHWVDVALSRDLASRIPDAQLTVVDGRSPLPGVGDIDDAADVIAGFLGAREEAEARHPDRQADRHERVLATILFTDIVGSTERAVALGDRAWRELLDRHHAAVRAAIARFGGREVDTTGDGFFVLFDGPGPAIRAAEAAAGAVRELGLEVRAGIHSGEVEVAGSDARGIAVHVGARVMALAGGGEIFVSSTVRDLVAGSGIAFDDRGTHSLKGVPGEWQIFSVHSTRQS